VQHEIQRKVWITESPSYVAVFPDDFLFCFIITNTETDPALGIPGIKRAFELVTVSGMIE
jgi:hypothetical protein